MKVSCTTSSHIIPKLRLSKCFSTDVHCGCHQNPCQHGTCLSQQKEGYSCVFCNCDYGFTGQLCDQQLDYFCPCLNGGTCHKDHSGCLCSNGYYGEFCQIMSDKI